MRTTIDIPADLFRKAKARAAARGESLKALLTRAVAAEVGRDSRTAAQRRMTLPIFGNPKSRPVELQASDLARALADEDAVRVGRRRRRHR
jgi:hypothetical protein